MIPAPASVRDMYVINDLRRVDDNNDLDYYNVL